MRKLISANFYRLFRNKIFYIELAAVFGFSLWIVFANYAPEYQASANRLYLEDVFFNLYQLLGVFLSATVSLILGSEYGDGAIRNKLVVGHTRLQIYGAQLVTNLCGTILVLALHGLTTGVLGILLFGTPQMQTGLFVAMIGCSCLIALVQTALYVALSMNISSKAISSVVSILLACAMLLFANAIFNRLNEPKTTFDGITITMDGVEFGEEIENPAYVEGMERTIHQWVLDLLPEGQIIQIQSKQTERIGYWVPLVVVFFALSTGIGYECFRRKDIN